MKYLETFQNNLMLGKLMAKNLYILFLFFYLNLKFKLSHYFILNQFKSISRDYPDGFCFDEQMQ